MQTKTASIRFRPVDGVWETLGTSTAAQVWAENVNLEWDSWGPKSAQFDLRRDPRASWPDIKAYTPVEIDVGGVQVWKGRVQGTPARAGGDPAISVQCEGLQAHLDDDVFVPAYVHTKLSDYRDGREFSGANLTSWTVAGVVTAGSGVITMGWPNGTVLPAGAIVGVTLDLGSGGAGRGGRVVYARAEFTGLTGPANMTGNLIVRGRTAVASGLPTSDAGTLSLVTLGTSTNSITGAFDDSYRYVSIFLTNTAGALTLNGDVMVRIDAARLFSSAAYTSSGNSVLLATNVVTDALAQGTVLLDSDRTGISTTSFVISDFYTPELKTPREVISTVNAYHNYITKIDERGRPVFSALPSSPLIEVGEFTALDMDDSSANSGEDIYSRVIVTGQTAYGENVTIDRTQGQAIGAALFPATQVISNPSFATNTTGWTAAGTSVVFTRDTVTFDSTPASGYVTSSSGNLFPCGISTTVTGTFLKGVTYQVVVRIKGNTAYGGPAPANIVFGTARQYFESTTAGFTAFTVPWTPLVDTVNTTLTISGMVGISGSVYFNVDTVELYVAVPTLVDRAGFRRTKVLSMPTLDAAGLIGTQLADTYLASHKNAQFKGSATITGPTAREILTGKPIPPEQIGLRTGELLRFNDRIDPDTGAMGRDGRIESVRYSLTDDKAQVAIDNTSQNFEALLARLAVISGAG